MRMPRLLLAAAAAAACRCVPNRAGQHRAFSLLRSKESRNVVRFMRLNGHADLEEHAPLYALLCSLSPCSADSGAVVCTACPAASRIAARAICNVWQARRCLEG